MSCLKEMGFFILVYWLKRKERVKIEKTLLVSSATKQHCANQSESLLLICSIVFYCDKIYHFIESAYLPLVDI